jgi:hypothetical protein
MALKALVSAYMAAGRRWGFFFAEMTLEAYLPASAAGGKCYAVPPRDRAACAAALQAGPPEGPGHLPTPGPEDMPPRGVEIPSAEARR